MYSRQSFFFCPVFFFSSEGKKDSEHFGGLILSLHLGVVVYTYTSKDVLKAPHFFDALLHHRREKEKGHDDFGVERIGIEGGFFSIDDDDDDGSEVVVIFARRKRRLYWRDIIVIVVIECCSKMPPPARW